MDGWSRAFRTFISYFLEFDLLVRAWGSCSHQLSSFFFAHLPYFRVLHRGLNGLFSFTFSFAFHPFFLWIPYAALGLILTDRLIDGWFRAFRNCISDFLKFDLLRCAWGSCFYPPDFFFFIQLLCIRAFVPRFSHSFQFSDHCNPIESKLNPIQSFCQCYNYIITPKHFLRQTYYHTTIIPALHADRICTRRLEALQV